MTYEAYLKEKNERKSIWLQKVFAHSGDCDEELLLKEASDKFEAEYPKYGNKHIQEIKR